MEDQGPAFGPATVQTWGGEIGPVTQLQCALSTTATEADAGDRQPTLGWLYTRDVGNEGLRLLLVHMCIMRYGNAGNTCAW